MSQRRTIQGLAIILGLAGCVYGLMAPLDDILMRRLQQQSEIKQLAQMFEQDGQGMSISSNGTITLHDGEQSRLSNARYDEYRAMVKASGARWVSGGGPTTRVTLYYPPPLMISDATMKSLVYSPASQMPLTQVTNGRTDFYQFQPGQYQRVCRSIGKNWYVCKDNET